VANLQDQKNKSFNP